MKMSACIAFIFFGSLPIWAKDLKQAIVIGNQVRVRAQNNLSGQIIGHLEKNKFVSIIQRSASAVEIDGTKEFWYYIESSSNLKGWVFGKYLNILDTTQIEKYKIKLLFTWPDDKFFRSVWLLDKRGLREIVKKDSYTAAITGFSPNGNRIALFTCQPNCESPSSIDLSIYDVIKDNSEVVLSLNPTTLWIEDWVCHIHSIKFSPNEGYVSYVITKKDVPHELQVISLNNHKIHKFTLTSDYDWSPDSKNIVYFSSNTLVISDLDGNSKKLFIDAPPIARTWKGKQLISSSLGDPNFLWNSEEIFFQKGIVWDDGNHVHYDLYLVRSSDFQIIRKTNFGVKNAPSDFHGFMPGTKIFLYTRNEGIFGFDLEKGIEDLIFGNHYFDFPLISPKTGKIVLEKWKTKHDRKWIIYDPVSQKETLLHALKDRYDETGEVISGMPNEFYTKFSPEESGLFYWIGRDLYRLDLMTLNSEKIISLVGIGEGDMVPQFDFFYAEH